MKWESNLSLCDGQDTMLYNSFGEAKHRVMGGTDKGEWDQFYDDEMTLQATLVMQGDAMKLGMLLPDTGGYYRWG